MISIQTTRRIYEYFQNNKMDPVKTILMLDEESTETTDKYRVKCVNGLTYIVTETGDSIESVEKVES